METCRYPIRVAIRRRGRWKQPRALLVHPLGDRFSFGGLPARLKRKWRGGASERRNPASDCGIAKTSAQQYRNLVQHIQQVTDCDFLLAPLLEARTKPQLWICDAETARGSDHAK